MWDHSRVPSRLPVQGSTLPEEARTLETQTRSRGPTSSILSRRPPASALRGALDDFGTRQLCCLLLRAGAATSERP